MPRRIERKKTGPREVIATASERAMKSGLSRISSSVAPMMSKVRLSAKSTPSKAGGPSSKSGTDWPGTNSARWIRISIVEGARRTRMPRRWHWSTSSTAASWGKSASAMITSSTGSEPSTASRFSSGPSERRPSAASGVGERKPITSICACGWSASARATSAICLPRPTSTARRWKPASAQQQRGDAVVDAAEGADVENGEGERAVEEVVAREVFAVDEREDQRDDGDLEERAHDARQPGPQRALGVEARVREEQRGEQVAEGQEGFGAVEVAGRRSRCRAPLP